MTERHPLSDALDDAEHSPQAQAYEVPVELIRSRARRRRHARTGATAGALALVVAGAALVVPNLPSPTPTPATDDRPAPGLCGLSYDELAAEDGGPDPVPVQAPVPQGLQLTGVSQLADGTFVATTTFGAETFELQAGSSNADNLDAEMPTGDPEAWSYGTTLVLLHDDVVVAALPGDAAPALDAIPDIDGDVAALPLPLVTSIKTAVVACAHENALPSGEYEAVVTQTSGWLYTESEGIFVSRTTSEPVPVEVDGPAPVDPTPSPTVPAVCGLSTDDLAADDSDTGKTFEVLIDATSTPLSGPWSVATRIERSGPPGALWAAVGWTYGTTVALVQDGKVVGALEDHEAPTRELAARTDVDVDPAAFPIVLDLAADMISCATGEAGVTPGDYQLVASTTIGFVPESDPAVEPSIARATSDPVDVTVMAAPTASDPLVCGAPDDGLRALTDSGPLRVRTDSAPAMHPHGENASFTIDVTNQSDERVRATTGHPEVIVTRDGVIVGGLEATEDIGFDVDLDAGRSQTFDASSLMTACVGDHPGGSLPAGEYELWTVMSFTPHSGDGPDPGATWQTAGGPWPLTIVGDDEFSPTNSPRSWPSCGDTTSFLVDRVATTAAGDLTLDVGQWANPDPAVETRHRRLAQVDAAVTLTNGGDKPVVVGHVGLAAAQRGSIVSQGTVYMAVNPHLTVTVAPGETVTLPRPFEYGTLHECEGKPFPDDELDVWVLVDTDAGTFVAGPHTLAAAD